MNDKSTKHLLNRRTLAKSSAASMLAMMSVNLPETFAQEATPGATPEQAATPAATPSQVDTPAAGEMIEIPLASMPIAPGSEAEGALEDATVNLNLGSEINTGDPQVMAFLNEIEIGMKVYSPLLALNENNEIADAAADQAWMSEDGRVYQFHIREGLTYSDGTPCNAHNYAYALRRALDPVVSGNFSTALFAVTGGQEWRLSDPETDDYDALKATVEESIFAVDDQTLEIHLDFGAGYFPFVMATWITSPVREDLVEGNGAEWWQDINNYIGNGPFVVTEWVSDQRWVFEANEDHFRGKPGVQTLIFRQVGASETALLAFQQGELDAIGPAAAQLPQIEGDEELSAQLHRVPSASTNWLAFNLEVEPFTIKEVRQAFSYAMNREQYIEQVLNGVGTPAHTFLHPGIQGYQTDTVQSYDPDRAAELLAEAGFPGGEGFPTQTLYYNSESAIAQQQATYWAQGFQQALGVVVEPTPIDLAQIQNMRTNRDPNLIFYLGNWFESYPHPQYWLSLVFGRGSTRAPLGWENEEFYQLVEQADQLPLEEAVPLYQEADAMLAEETPVVFFLHGEGLVLMNPRVEGYVTYPTGLYDTRYQLEKMYVTAEAD